MTRRALPDEALQTLAGERANMEACIRCGLCLESCPTYVLTLLEEEGPRGRIAIARGLLDGHLEVTDDLVTHELNCLLCEACTDVCPAGVRMDELGVALRGALTESGATGRRERAVTRMLRVLGDRSRLRRMVRQLGWLRRLGLHRAASATGLLRALGLSHHSLPPIPRQFLEPDGGGWRPENGGTRGRAVLFAGCLMSTMLAPIDVATGELLAAAGYEVEVVRGQTCCGALSAHQGDLDTARDMGARNIAALSGDDAPIVLNSAGCGAFLKGYGHHFGLQGLGVASRVVDLSVMLAGAELDLSGEAPEGPVVFQDPCHLRSAQAIVEEPRALLSRIPGMDLVELNEPGMCCGSAGVYNVTHRHIARELSRRKAEDIIASGARTVVTANPGCLLQVRAALRQAGSRIPVLHLAEVMRRACPAPVERFGPEARVREHAERR
ncbi:MAG: (Fe-S)-binding protein [Actinomycetota bacterium]|nr:(Fe-S)-binding protein [Actinomycetota bacterium]